MNPTPDRDDDVARFARLLLARLRKAVSARELDEAQYYTELAETGALAWLLVYERLTRLEVLRHRLRLRWKRGSERT
ncbi:MAG: hypothetical protein ACHREM_05810 [Polyangiales bacterium]